MSSEMAGRRMLTAEVFAFTTRVEMQVTASTPRAARVLACATSLIGASFRLPPHRRSPATVRRRARAGLTPYGRCPQSRPGRTCRSRPAVRSEPAPSRARWAHEQTLGAPVGQGDG